MIRIGAGDRELVDALAEVLGDRLRGEALHDAGEVGTLLRVGAVEVGDGGADRSDELVVHVTLDEYVVGGDARLPRIHESSPHDAPSHNLDVAVVVHNGG